jgi:uncharacterized protein GlcG (DUF336 family)
VIARARNPDPSQEGADVRLFSGPSEGLWDLCKPGSPAPATEASNGGMIPYAGGVPLWNGDGSLIGVIGCAGGLPSQDGEVARSATDDTQV